MSSRTALALFAGLLAVGCGWTQRTYVRHTLLGVSQQQALVAAHRALVEQSFAIESTDLRTGALVTDWLERPGRSIRYVITTVPRDTAQPGVPSVEVTVRAEARDRAVRGWTDEYPTPNEASRMLRRVEREAQEVAAVAPLPAPTPPAPPPRVEEPPAPPERPCTGSRDCPPGQHCGSGRCVWECATDAECDGGGLCDRRGRCVAPPAPQPATPEAPAQGEE
jgi:hypothetical protein